MDDHMGQTIVEKIAQAHMADGPDRPLRAGDFLSIRPYHVMTHDNTSAVMKKFNAIGAKRVYDPAQPVFTADHDIQNKDATNLDKYAAMEAFAREQGIDFYPPGTGIGHQIMVEQGYVLPGTFVVASDSHSNMYGALGAIGTPVVRTDAAAIWATGEFWWQIPRTIQVVLEGQLAAGATGKDVIVTLCGLYNQEEVLNAAVEFTGPGVASLSMDARLTIANMSTEWGTLVGWFPVDEVTLRYLERRTRELRAHGITRIPQEKFAEWRANPPAPDADASYAGRIVLNLAEVTPHVSGPDTVQVMRSVAEVAKKKVAIQKAYLVSCVNSRLEDLEAAAKVLKGKKVAPGVKFYLAAASRAVQEEAERRGVWQTLLDAGAHPLPSGCGPCIGLGTARPQHPRHQSRQCVDHRITFTYRHRHQRYASPIPAGPRRLSGHRPRGGAAPPKATTGVQRSSCSAADDDRAGGVLIELGDDPVHVGNVAQHVHPAGHQHPGIGGRTGLAPRHSTSLS